MIKNRVRNNRISLLFFSLFLLANLYSISRLSVLKESVDSIFVCYTSGSAGASGLEQLKENEQSQNFSKMALWKSMEEVTVFAENTGRQQKVSCYQVGGQLDAVFGNHLVQGRYFTEEEHTVCVIDEGLAQQLFGSEHVLGMEVEVEQKAYQIIGILERNKREGAKPVCVIPAREDTVFDGVAVQKQEMGQSSALAISLLEAFFGRTDGQKVDGQLYFTSAVLFYSAMSALMMILMGIVMAKKRGTFLAETSVEKGEDIARIETATAGKILFGFIGVVCVAAAVVISIAGIKAAAPGADYLPTYWSDFDFFVRLFQEKAEQIQRLAASQEFSVWQDMFSAWQQVIIGEIFAGVLFGCFLIDVRYCIPSFLLL